MEIRTDDIAYLRPLLQMCNFLYGTHSDGCCKSPSGMLASSAMILSACASLTYPTLENLISSPKTTVSVYLMTLVDILCGHYALVTTQDHTPELRCFFFLFLRE
jgi:hypothetical protein